MLYQGIDMEKRWERGGPASWRRQTVPIFFLTTASLPHCSYLPAVCRTRYASPTAARITGFQPCTVKAALVGIGRGVGALALALTGMVSSASPRGRQIHWGLRGGKSQKPDRG